MFRELLYLILGPILTLVLLVFCIGLLVRTTVFISRLYKSDATEDSAKRNSVIHMLKLIGAACLPFHKAYGRQPMYTLIRYLFHACLFMVPLLEAGHVVMLQVRFGSYWWPTLPGSAVTVMTFLVIGMGLFFISRRIADPQVRQSSSLTDFVIILVSISPFITGYWYAHDSMGRFSVPADTMLMLHLFSGEMMLIMVVFLFVRTRISNIKCVGCAACSMGCPTGTLETREAGNLRSFLYSHYQCICCGNCVADCPENAASLRHQIGLNYFFAFFKKLRIREKELIPCAGCRVLFAPDRQMQKIQDQISDAGIELPETLKYCSRCKKLFSTAKPLPLTSTGEM